MEVASFPETSVTNYRSVIYFYEYMEMAFPFDQLFGL